MTALIFPSTFRTFSAFTLFLGVVFWLGCSPQSAVAQVLSVGGTVVSTVTLAGGPPEITPSVLVKTGNKLQLKAVVEPNGNTPKKLFVWVLLSSGGTVEIKDDGNVPASNTFTWAVMPVMPKGDYTVISPRQL